jgi:hypothetical protein
MIPQTREEVAEAMEDDPESWAELFLEQQQLIDDLEELLGEYQIRLAMLLRDPDEEEH